MPHRSKSNRNYPAPAAPRVHPLPASGLVQVEIWVGRGQVKFDFWRPGSLMAFVADLLRAGAEVWPADLRADEDSP